MRRTPYLLVAVAPILAALLLAVPLAADALRLAPVKDSAVANECSACHMLYPAGLLPARSWSAMIADLANHFGDNAELDAATAKRVADYLTANSADGVGVSGKVLRGLDPALVPKRITELPWWKGSRRNSGVCPQRRQVQGRLQGVPRGCRARYLRR